MRCLGPVSGICHHSRNNCRSRLLATGTWRRRQAIFYSVMTFIALAVHSTVYTRLQGIRFLSYVKATAYADGSVVGSDR